MLMVDQHIQTLVHKHSSLEQKILQAYRNFTPDSAIQELKREKLAVKDRIYLLKQLNK